jgi:hypothetical protein
MVADAGDVAGMVSVRVPEFLPSRNGLHFTNSWPNEPNYTLDILGQRVSLGNASQGLCGGMAYTVSDLYQARQLPPAQTANPAAGSPLFNYIVARLTNSFDAPDVTHYLSWIQLPDGDNLLEHGLAWHEISQEWPMIKQDLDSGIPSALGLVAGQQPPVVGFLTGISNLAACHQVLAWGYDLNGSALTIHIYDPDHLGDNNTISLNIANPAKPTPLTVSNWAPGRFRGFFRTHYQYHDPRTPVSGAFIETVVTSPGITTGGPIPGLPPAPARG